jgi:choline-sulfatase
MNSSSCIQELTETMNPFFSKALPAVCLVGLLFGPGQETACGQLSAEVKRPNVVLIAIDDLNDWCGPLGGHPMAITPNMDRMASAGVTFTNAHCNSPLCNSSRASLMTGLRPSTTGIYGLEPSFRTIDRYADWKSLPQYFTEAGYTTYGAGKLFHWGVHSIAPAAKSKRPELEHLAPDFMVTGPAGGIGARPESKLVENTPMGNHPLVDWGTFPHQDQDKGDYQVASWAVEQIQNAPLEEPFFLAAGFFLPHVPCYATEKWFELYPDDESILPAILPGDRDDTPRFSWYLHWELPEPRQDWLQENDQWIPLVRSYLACISFVDAQVGRILDALERQNLMDNTVVVLWSDHGWHLGEKQITGKNSLWDESTRVPLIFCGPGVSSGVACSQPAELLDIYPTLIDLCELQPNDELEGLSLLPQLIDAQSLRSRPAITTHNSGNHGIRSQHYRYIRYADGSEEFYDHRSDPNEWQNVLDDPSYAEEIERHRSWIPAWDAPPAAGSAHRILTYDAQSDEAVWEGKVITRRSPIPE